MSALTQTDLKKYIHIRLKTDWEHSHLELEGLPFVYPQPGRHDHLVRVFPASDSDKWYGIVHIGEFASNEDPLEHPSLREFYSFGTAWAWSIRYVYSHPDGLSPDTVDDVDNWSELGDSVNSDDSADLQYYDWSVHQ